MPNKLLYLGISASFAAIAAAAFYFSYEQFRKPAVPDNAAQISEASVSGAPVLEIQEEFDEETAEAVSLPEKITEATNIVYEYYYEADGKTERVKQKAPQSLVNLTREQLEKALEEFSVSSFSKSEVVLRKNVSGAEKNKYILGVWDGFVAVFYAGGNENNRQNGLKELTDTPVSSLSHEERERLLSGVEIVGDEELMRVLEDYGS